MGNGEKWKSMTKSSDKSRQIERAKRDGKEIPMSQEKVCDIKLFTAIAFLTDFFNFSECLI